MPQVLLDTDVLSEVLKRRRGRAVAAAESYLEVYGRLTISAISQYEVERGLLAKRAVRYLAELDLLLRVSEVLPVSADVLRRAAKLWATASWLGKSRNDADLLIAATALEYDLPLVTGNRSHFDWIEELQLEAWW